MSVAAEVAAARGRPVVALLAILVLWVLLRLVFWQSPLLLARAPSGWPDGVAGSALTGPLAASVRAVEVVSSAGRLVSAGRLAPLLQIESKQAGEAVLIERSAHGDIAPDFSPVRQESPPGLLSALAQPPGSHSLGEWRDLAASATTMADPVYAPVSVAPSRWTMSSWLFLRDGSPGDRQAATTPNYGRSQAGAVLAYNLAPDSAHRPQAYSRVTSALEGPRDIDLALGLSSRPLPEVPLRLAAEARLNLRDGTSELRPAAYAVTELLPMALPGQIIGEAYAQAGWVGGDFATGFVDAQLRVTRQLATSRAFTLFAGGGGWAGAQKDTRRVDIGPSVGASFRLGDDVYGRLSADYRMRVAGNAAPASGPALTLSAGF